MVNRRKDPVEVTLTDLNGVPKGWDVNFNSRYPSFPVRSVTVQGGEKPISPPLLSSKRKSLKNTKPESTPSKSPPKIPMVRPSTLKPSIIASLRRKIETGGLKLTSQYPVLSTGSGQTLKFTVDLKNETNKPLTTSLVAQAPPGWTVRFKPQFGDQQISSIQLKENGSETLERRDRHAGEGRCQRISGR